VEQRVVTLATFRKFDLCEMAEDRGDFAAQAGSPSSVGATATSGFRWGAAGIGAAASAAVLLVLVGCSLIVLRRRGAFAH
jgi:hypothetical protein